MSKGYSEWVKVVDNNAENGIVNLGGVRMHPLPRAEEAVIPSDKFFKYALNPSKDPDKAIAFDLALGYNIGNADILINKIKSSLNKFPAINKGDIGYGIRYEVVMDIVGANGKTAKVLTGWIDDVSNGEMRLTTVHID